MQVFEKQKYCPQKTTYIRRENHTFTKKRILIEEKYGFLPIYVVYNSSRVVSRSSGGWKTLYIKIGYSKPRAERGLPP